MYIANVSDMNQAYSCTPFIGKWLIEKNFPVLSLKDGKYYFAETELLKEVVDTIPLWMKILDIF
jgi:hypothetical protein